MITSNTSKPFGGKVATLETPAFSCFVSTAKDGFFKKQSMIIWDTTNGIEGRQVAAKLEYNKALDADARLGLHDAIIHAIDESGMAGIGLAQTLATLCERLHKEGVASPSIAEAWWNSQT